MTFDISGFKLVGESTSPGAEMYTYSSPDLKATIAAASYFDNVAPYSLDEGDTIVVTIDNDGTIDTMTLVVNDVTAGVVTTTTNLADVTAATRAGKVYINGVIDDVSTAASFWVPVPVAGTITRIDSVINGAIATADAALTFEIGGVAVTGGAITVAYSGSAAGDVDTATPTAANTLAAGGSIECITDGASTNTIKAELVFEITLS